MTAWHSPFTAPFRKIWAFVALFLGNISAKANSISPAKRDQLDPKPSQNRRPDDLTIDLATSLLTKVREGLSGHSAEMAAFVRALNPVQGSSASCGSLARMQAANLGLEELVESTVDRLKRACGSLLSEEQLRLEGYREKTNAFDKRLAEVPNELLLTHVVAELLVVVQELRNENDAVRSEIVKAQERICQLSTRAVNAEREARTDTLTGLLNRRAFNEIHAACHAEGQYKSYCLLLIDVDFFKSINDRYGHAAGDAVLSLVGRFIRENCRTADRSARWGGEEYAVLMPDADEAVALRVAERLRTKLEATILYCGQNRISFTISCGIAQSDPNKTQGQIMEEADQALYAAKEQGRNKSFVYRDRYKSGLRENAIPG